MAQFEAVFADGTVATFEADSMKVDHGLVVLERSAGGVSTVVVAIGGSDLVFVRDTDVEVELIEGDDEWDEDDWEDDDDDDEDDSPGRSRS